MFGRKKNKSEVVVPPADNQAVPAINMVSENTVIQGLITGSDDIRVSGKVDGEIEITAKCIVSASGTVIGNINSKDADIAGKVEGHVVSANRLILRQSAHVTGDIKTNVLLIEEGAKFDGACRMGSTISLEKESEV
ncbi:Polymer-forming protein [Cyclonatronum proteinivorum]|uniref:Polymer-forming protein n=1 Tax=Cyclonatronum proteinivorum TaxID=1457365 RepID=A0A345UJ12_9BACT|nr:polymer-forming cytoskeletal protein [Cyclonatronum proteinivorum]AXJ00464.1 Polymer-forming protein [Cyclonatronum proteinivorum]